MKLAWIFLLFCLVVNPLWAADGYIYTLDASNNSVITGELTGNFTQAEAYSKAKIWVDGLNLTSMTMIKSQEPDTLAFKGVFNTQMQVQPFSGGIWSEYFQFVCLLQCESGRLIYRIFRMQFHSSFAGGKVKEQKVRDMLVQLQRAQEAVQAGKDVEKNQEIIQKLQISLQRGSDELSARIQKLRQLF